MIPAAEDRLRVVGLTVVADVEPTSRFSGGDAAPDTVQIGTTFVLEAEATDLVVPFRSRPGDHAVAGLASGGRVVRVHQQVLVAPVDGEYHLTLQVPDPPELIEVVEGSPVSVVVTLPLPLPGEEPTLVSWSQEKNPVVFGHDGQPALAGRSAVSWQFDRDPTLDIVWRYVGSGHK